MNVIDSGSFHAEVNTELLDRLLIHGENEKAIRKIVKQVLQKARNRVSQAAKDKIKNDPRQAYRAVKHTVYRSILGGSVSILAKRKASDRREPPSSRRSGQRSARTKNLLSYWGVDRGFILRFINSGTRDRTVEHFNNRSIKRESVDDRPRRKGGYRSGQIGFRGHIEPGNWFPAAGQKQMEQAAQELSKLVEEEIAKHFNK